MTDIMSSLTKLIDDMLYNIDEGEYDGCNGSWEREILYEIKRHPNFDAVRNLIFLSHDPDFCASDILALVKYVDAKRGKIT